MEAERPIADQAAHDRKRLINELYVALKSEGLLNYFITSGLGDGLEVMKSLDVYGDLIADYNSSRDFTNNDVQLLQTEVNNIHQGAEEERSSFQAELARGGGSSGPSR